MARWVNSGVLPRLLLLLALLPLLGVTPLAHQPGAELQQARHALASNSPAEAARHIAAAASRQPGRADLWELAGHYALEGGQPQLALDYFKNAQRSAQAGPFFAPGGLSPQGQVEMGQAYQDTGDLEGAIENWKAVQATQGNSSDLTRRLLEAHLVLKDYPGALHDLQTLAELQPGDAQVHYRLGVVTAASDPEAALPHLERAASLDPLLRSDAETLRQAILSARLAENPAYSLLEAGRALARLGEWELASQAFENATLLRPDFAEAWAYLGEARQQLFAIGGLSQDSSPADSPPGLAELQKALELNPNSLVTHSLLAMFWARQTRYDRAVESMRTAVALAPHNPTLQAELGNLLALSGDLNSAFEAYQQAAMLAPEDPTYQRLLLQFILTFNYQVEALALPLARQLVIQYPGDPASLDLMAQTLIQRNDLASAERFLGQALQIDPDYAPAHLHLGLVHALRQEYPAALGEFNMAARALDPAVAEQARRLLETYFP